jgi:hypothetical protein
MPPPAGARGVDALPPYGSPRRLEQTVCPTPPDVKVLVQPRGATALQAMSWAITANIGGQNTGG